MQKDVIYIDVEDDITAIIGKVKDAKEKVVALVPPKRIGVLQSAVNLRLLARTADTANKRLVLITNNSALSGLAASAKIPVAKNLQSKPELATIPALKVDDDDIIEGDKLPVGDHAKSADDIPVSGMVPPSTIDNIDIDGDSSPMAAAAPSRKPGAKKGIKVPDFGTFRKKVFLIAGAAVLLIAFLIWAIWYAPHATVVISAKTSDQELSQQVTVGPAVTTDSDQAHIQSVEQQEKATQTIEFDATGKKNAGEKATGTVKFTKATAGDVYIGAGTRLTSSSGMVFTTNSVVTVPGATLSFGCSGYLCPGSASIGVTATEGGTNYNGANGGLTGVPAGVQASFEGPTAGGTDKNVTIVLQSDVEKARQQLAEQNSDDAKKKLKEKFAKDVSVIDSSFKVTSGDPQSSPAIGQEATGKAKLTQETTYVMVGVAKAQLDAYLNSTFEDKLPDNDKQKVYDNGASTVKFADFTQGEGNQAGTAALTATAQIGPKIDDNEIKELVKGKRYGEIEGDLKAIDGVSDVAVKLSPFWVQGVPDDTKKITIEFKLIKNG